MTAAVTGRVAQGSRQRSRPPRGRVPRWAGLAFIAPFLLVFAGVLAAPIAYALYLSLFRDQLVGGHAFVALGNYAQVLADARFWAGVGRVSMFLLVQVPVMLVLALVAALALDSSRLVVAPLFRIAIFLPYAVPGVVATLIWGFIYGDQFGLVGQINQLLGSAVVQPFASGAILPSIGNIVTWEFLGYNMLIFYAALRVVPAELYEAAELDGAGPLQVIRAVKLPALRGALVLATVFSVIGSFQLFNEPNLLRTLSPNVISTDFTPNMYAYHLSFAGQQYNYAGSVAIVMGLITAAIAWVAQVKGSREEAR